MATILVIASKILIAFLTTLICYIILEADQEEGKKKMKRIHEMSDFEE